MDGFRILTNRRRAIIALVHTVIFLAIAIVQLALSRPTPNFKLHASTTVSSAIVIGIYFTVTAILLLLFRISRVFNERIYFALCATSASFGLLRAVYGDPPMHFAHYFRVLMLSCAVLVGTLILRSHSEIAAD
jgi:formate-dependent nitrite reductase membrane component NrfD